MALHLELDRWIYSIEAGDQNTPRIRRQLQVLDKLHEKYWKIHVKRLLNRCGANSVPKRCKWRFPPPPSQNPIK